MASREGWHLLSGLSVSAASGRKRGNFNGLTYTARNVAKSVIGVGFKPDMMIVKDRVNSNKTPFYGYFLNTNTPAPYESIPGPEINIASNPGTGGGVSPGPLKSFDEDGFTIGADDSVCKTAVASDNFAAWCWKRHADFFNIINYQGDGASSKNVAHGLTSAPKMVWGFVYGSPATIYVYHASNTGAPETDYLELNSGDATVDDIGAWNDTAPNGTNVTVGSLLNANGTNHTLICFAEQAGFSKFGSYTGNGSATGPIVTGLGFTPKMVLIKRTDTGSSHWTIFDRNRVNPGVENYYLALEDTAQEFSGVGVLLQTEGFQPVSTNANTNASGGTYVYAAFA